jgi:hypothetical protein
MAEFNQDSSFSSGECVKNMELIDNQNPDESEQLKQDKEHIYRYYFLLKNDLKKIIRR